MSWTRGRSTLGQNTTAHPFSHLSLSVFSLLLLSLYLYSFTLFSFFASVSLTYFLYSSFSFKYRLFPCCFIVCSHLLTLSDLALISLFKFYSFLFSSSFFSLSSLHLLISLFPSLVSPCHFRCSICVCTGWIEAARLIGFFSSGTNTGSKPWAKMSLLVNC